MSVRIGHTKSGVTVLIQNEDAFCPPLALHRPHTRTRKYQKYRVVFNQDRYILSPVSVNKDSSSNDSDGFSMTQLPNGTFKLVASRIKVFKAFSDTLDVMFFKRHNPSKVTFDVDGRVVIYPDYPEQTSDIPDPMFPKSEGNLKRKTFGPQDVAAHTIPGPVVKVSTTKHYHLQLTPVQLIEWMNGNGPTGHEIPSTARIWVDIPGGGDFSLDTETVLNITWTELEE